MIIGGGYATTMQCICAGAFRALGVSCGVARAAEMTCRIVLGALHPRYAGRKCYGALNAFGLSAYRYCFFLRGRADGCPVPWGDAEHGCTPGRVNTGKDIAGHVKAAEQSCCAQVSIRGPPGSRTACECRVDILLNYEARYAR